MAEKERVSEELLEEMKRRMEELEERVARLEGASKRLDSRTRSLVKFGGVRAGKVKR